MRVAILGMGRLGASILPLARDAGLSAIGWSRGEPIPASMDLYWITTRDEAVPEIAERLPADAVVLHAAGAHGPELLGARAERGVLHPLMTFPGPAVGIPSLRGVGARVAGTDRAQAAATALATALGMHPFRIEGDARRYHAAACLASGHLGALFLEAAALLQEAGMPEAEARAVLLPLAAESLRRVAQTGPAALTGPATRGDWATEREHLDVLDGARASLYATLADRLRAHRA